MTFETLAYSNDLRIYFEPQNVKTYVFSRYTHFRKKLLWNVLMGAFKSDLKLFLLKLYTLTVW